MNQIDLNIIIDRNNKIIKSYIEQYSLDRIPIEVSFRTLLPEIKKIDRYTHLIHSYPAKLLVHIPYFFLNNTVFSKEGDKVLDPFNGSGTVILESILAKRNAFGADANPLARLIAEVKVTSLNSSILKENLENIILKAKSQPDFIPPNVANCEFWFPKKTIESLSRILFAIKEIKDSAIKNFMMVALSSCVKKVSYADQRISVPVKLNPQRYTEGGKENHRISERLRLLETLDIFDKFHSIVSENIKRNDLLHKDLSKNFIAKIISDDARKLTKFIGSKESFPDKSIQLIMTSPPYAGAQKYIRASRLNLAWTELAQSQEIMMLDKKNIGRENYRKSEMIISKTGIKEADDLIEEIHLLKPERAIIVCTYLNEMKDALDEMCRVLKNRGFLVLIVGNNKVCNKEFNTQQYLTEYLLSKGLALQFKLIDDIKSYGLMTKRNKTADIISREWVLVFKK